MATLELTIPDALYDEWEIYANAAGLSVEAMIQEAATHSVRNDRLGVEQARLQRLLRETREIELMARQGKAVTPSATSTEPRQRAHASDSGSDRAQPKKENKPAKVASTPQFSEEALEDARVPHDFADQTQNMANLEVHIPRDV